MTRFTVTAKVLSSSTLSIPGSWPARLTVAAMMTTPLSSADCSASPIQLYFYRQCASTGTETPGKRLPSVHRKADNSACRRSVRRCCSFGILRRCPGSCGFGFDIDGDAVVSNVIDQVDLIVGRNAEPQPPVNRTAFGNAGILYWDLYCIFSRNLKDTRHLVWIARKLNRSRPLQQATENYQVEKNE